jgi:predicted Rossmann fold nucleotide-binding protein DprA/Smf involved in DNA uptake
VSVSPTAAGAASGDAARVALLLVDRLVDVGAKPLTASEFWPLVDAVADLGELVTLDAASLEAVGPVAEVGGERVRTLLDAATAMAFALDRLEQSGIWTVSALDRRYPDVLRRRLGPTAPPVLHGAGPVDLLTQEGLAVVGSRDVDERGGRVAQDAARLAARTGRVLLSGGARGVDQLAMAAADELEGPVVGVVADSLERTLRRPEVRRAVSDGRVCLCTPFKPTAGFSAANAMGRNKVIYGLATVTLVVASDLDEGGSWAGATEALRRGFGRVAVWRGEGEGPGNGALADRGAHEVHSMDDLEGVLAAAAAEPMTALGVAAAPQQLGLPL